MFRKADPVLAQLAAFIREAGPRGAPAPRSPRTSSRATPRSPASTRCWNGSSPTRRSPGPSGAGGPEGGRATDIVIAHEHYELTNNAPDQDKP
ncbi:hypothetical protein ACFQ0O_41345 [Saccharopolyspora spinosporotrichia]